MIVVTGAAGFIGSNIIKQLNQRDHFDIVAVDDLSDGAKFINLAGVEIADYLDKEEFLRQIKNNSFKPKIAVIFHQGACSTTTEWDGRFLLQNNYEYSKTLLHYCLEQSVQFLYASSAAVYGDGKIFKEERALEKPLNVYGYSKFLFDQYVRKYLGQNSSQIVGFRYFNVYGPHEQHKGSMASVAYHLHQQLKKADKVKLFEGCDGYGDGEQRRDFVYVDDVVDVNLWFWDHQRLSGIFNVGTGNSQSFNDVAQAVIAWNKKGEIEYIPFPDHLKGRYQSFTQADIGALRKVGYEKPFKRVEEGVKAYLDCLEK